MILITATELKYFHDLFRALLIIEKKLQLF